MKIALIGCSKVKKHDKSTAKEMYLASTLFNKAVNYIEAKGYDGYFILSAKYGLLDPNQIIENYNITLNSFNKKELITWTENVFKYLGHPNIKEIDFYCGDKYRKYLIPMLEAEGIKCNVPLKGMGIGQQLQFYTVQK